MDLKSNTESNAPLYIRLHQAIKDRILSGKLAVGDKVPHEEDLCEQYNVSAITVRKAMSALVDEGLVHRIRGTGTFVKSCTLSPSGDANRTIALVFANTYGIFPGNIISGAEQAARKAGYRVQVHVSNEDYTTERIILEQLINEKPAGVILLCVWQGHINPNCDIYLEVKKKGIPLVLIDRYVSGLQIDHVVSDDLNGAFSITEHFINVGHKSIGYLREPSDVTSVSARFSGFQKAMADHKLAIDSRQILYCARNPQNPSPGEEYYSRILSELRKVDELPSAFLCELDSMAISLYMAMLTLGVKVPERVAIGGFGDEPAGAILPIPLTTVMQPQEQIGSKAVEVILSRISGSSGAEPIQMALPTKLIVRNSCGSNIPEFSKEQQNASGKIRTGKHIVSIPKRAERIQITSSK